MDKLFEYQYLFRCSLKGNIYPVTRWCQSFKEASILPDCVLTLAKYDKYINLNQTFVKHRPLCFKIKIGIYILKRKLYMFWNRKQRPTVKGALGDTYSFQHLIPPRKQFTNMYDLLKEAERLDNMGEADLSKDILTVLYNYICEFQREEP